uniref:Cysteine-rich with EGF-like domain protein 1 n=1 Tax=Crassostrea virginica TaxID=6565 RepID=A0A8B8ANE1_CRAVI|nr:cysteine-rich with EGF-like domain protein 1 [Crassostrea virginica]
MFCMRSGLVIACIFVLGVESYWYQYFKEGPFFHKNWKLHHRSLNCVETDDLCGLTSQCCDPSNVCLRDQQQSILMGKEVGVCRNMKPNLEVLKSRGEKCSDSVECGIGLCCRSIFLFRFGKVNRCEKSNGPYLCISSETFEN